MKAQKSKELGGFKDNSIFTNQHRTSVGAAADSKNKNRTSSNKSYRNRSGSSGLESKVQNQLRESRNGLKKTSSTDKNKDQLQKYQQRDKDSRNKKA